MRILLLILIPALSLAQSVKKGLLQANSFYFKQHCYVYGYSSEKNGLNFKLYKFNKDLSKTDTTQFVLGKDKVENYLEINADTLHGYLNFYFQKINSKNLVTLIRLNDSLRLITKVENFDVTKVNRMASMDEEKFYFRNSIYTIRNQEDSLGKQYYLNKYDVVDEKKPFEYQQIWQFPLEKQNVNTVHVFYADSQLVFLYATILSGNNKGEWVLKVDATNGTLIKGKRISIKGDSKNFLMSGHYYDKEKRELMMLGNIYTEAQVNLETKTFTFLNNNKSNTFFVAVMDSTNDISLRQEKALPIRIENLKVDPKTALPFYHFRINSIEKAGRGEFSVYGNIYKSTGTALQFLYETGYSFNFKCDEFSGLEITPDKIFSNTAALSGLVNNDEKDINGKIIINSITDFDKFFYRKPVADVEVWNGRDDNSNPKWILKKTDIKSSNTTFYKVKLGAKGMENSTLLENSKYNHPNIYKLKNDQILLFNFDSNANVFELSVKDWL
jgi:hypothetical protein